MTRRPDTNRSARRSSRAGKSLEPTGPETFALVDTPLGKLMARVPGKVHQQIGEQVFLHWSPGDAHLVDAKSERRIN